MGAKRAGGASAKRRDGAAVGRSGRGADGEAKAEGGGRGAGGRRGGSQQQPLLCFGAGA